MGDVVGLMRDFEAVVDEKEAERDTKKMLRGQFTLQDFLKQLKMIQKVGSVKDIYEKFPICGDQGPPEGAELNDNMFKVMESIIQSMTPLEREQPALIDESRSKRIAKGSGRKPEQVKDLLQRFTMMQQMMQSFAMQPGLMANLPGFKQLSKLRGKKGQGMGDMFGDPQKMAKEMQKLSGGRMPAGMPAGLPGLPGMPAGGGCYAWNAGHG